MTDQPNQSVDPMDRARRIAQFMVMFDLRLAAAGFTGEQRDTILNTLIDLDSPIVKSIH